MPARAARLAQNSVNQLMPMTLTSKKTAATTTAAGLIDGPLERLFCILAFHLKSPPRNCHLPGCCRRVRTERAIQFDCRIVPLVKFVTIVAKRGAVYKFRSASLWRICWALFCNAVRSLIQRSSSRVTARLTENKERGPIGVCRGETRLALQKHALSQSRAFHSKVRRLETGRLTGDSPSRPYQIVGILG